MGIIPHGNTPHGANKDLLLRYGAMNNNQISPAHETGGARQQPGSSPPQRILVVEDDACIRQLNTEVLIQFGYAVDAAEDGAAAWRALHLADFDLMVTDNEMPKISGVELLKKMRAARMDLPVIMATAVPPITEFARCPWLQPAAVLCKPYTVDELVGTVREVLRVSDGAPGQTAAPPNPPGDPPVDSWQM
jgi:DNA-binding response OmpR family regulator